MKFSLTVAQMTSLGPYKQLQKLVSEWVQASGTPKMRRTTVRLGVLQLTVTNVSTSNKQDPASWYQGSFNRTMCLITSSPEALVSST